MGGHWNQGFPYRAVRPCTARYVPVRQLISMRTGRYQAVPPKDGRRWSTEGKIDRRWSILAIGGRFWRNREGKKKKKKKTKRRKKKRRRKGTSSRPRPRAVATRGSPTSQPPGSGRSAYRQPDGLACTAHTGRYRSKLQTLVTIHETGT
ncbi:hypothetical protein BHE74_00017395 [Ensete ventricosum]|nr:hypothetical protein BHE74_00017395 [Ensete ventricosum]